MTTFPPILVPWLVGVALNTILLSIVAFAPKKLLTPAGVINAWFLGVMIWGILGWQGYLIVGFYFLVGSAVTRIGSAEKEAAGIAEKRSGARGPENVWGSALVATICAIAYGVEQSSIALFLNQTNTFTLIPSPVLLLAYVASFSTKLSDTTASEVGKAYGKRTFLITTLKPVSPGTEGAISLEGTLAGILASAVIAVVGWIVGLISPVGVLYCLVAAFIATNLESLIGATLQEKFKFLTNEVVNIVNTFLGAMIAGALALTI